MNNLLNKTKDYNKFKTNKFQPEHRPKPSKDMLQSIKETNGNILCPIIIDSNFEVIDGHRRLQACKACNSEVWYVSTDSLGIDSARIMMLLNTTSRQWNTQQYIEFHSKQKEEYMELKNFIEDNSIPFALLTSFAGLSTSIAQSGGDLNLDYSKLSRMINVYNIVRGYYSSLPTNVVHRTLGKLYKLTEFSDKRLIDKLEVYFGEEESGFKLDKNGFIKQLCSVYDYKSKGSQRVNLEPKLMIKGLI